MRRHAAASLVTGKGVGSVDRAEVLLVGGRSGVGKSSVGWEVSALLRGAAVGG